MFSLPSSFVLKGSDLLFSVLREIMPMNRNQYADLPMACRDLSAFLTTDRSSRSKPYWSSPRLTSAYLRYFLPWNILRLTSLLGTLSLSLPSGAAVLDIGSGPLTFPIALWLAREDLRNKELNITAADTDDEHGSFPPIL